MHRGRAAALVSLLLVLVAIDAAAVQRRHKWWQSDEVKAELALTDETSAALEAIFQAARPRQRDLMRELGLEEEALSRVIRAPEAGEAAVIRQIDRVEKVRSALSRARILMLYRMRRELSAEQRDALREWLRRNRRHRSQPSACR